jgi:hypothetical protein
MINRCKMPNERACANKTLPPEFSAMLDDILDIRDVLRSVRTLAALDSYFVIVTLMDAADAIAEDLVRDLSSQVQEVTQ